MLGWLVGLALVDGSSDGLVVGSSDGCVVGSSTRRRPL